MRKKALKSLRVSPKYDDRENLIRACIVEYLVEKGADVNVMNYDSDSGKTALIYACEEGLVDVVKYLVQKNARINAIDDNEMTALMWACIKGSLDVVECLIQQNAKVDVMDRNGMTALTHAYEGGSLHIMKYLLKKGADINAGGKPVLIYACEKKITGDGEVSDRKRC